MDEQIIKKTRKALEANGFRTEYLENRSKVNEYLASVMEAGSSCAVGGSVSLFECDVFSLLRSGRYEFYDRYEDGVDIKEIYRKSFSVDYYLASANAITENGELIFIDGRGNRVAAIAYGPDNVILIVSVNKICKNINWEKENPFPELFSYTGLNISYETDTSLCYWEFFAPYAVGSLLAALNNKNLFDITKDKQLRDQIPLLIAETAEIAAGEGLELNKDALIKKLYAVPMNYRFPLQDEINGSGCGETNLISSVLMNAARSGKTRFMDSRLNKILKQIYNLILV